ncbi:unnamed protein product [Peronospora farinosa]|uniref:NB-ARC domain-containing protein n=1 Tax=Peronospora farinosa TaxID=134698 RepID=A0AAV0UC50_9STRA|nr:unnamed protein product [Peronospora farinosa]
MFWRRRDDKIVSLLLDGWFRESSPLSKKKSIMVVSPGIGKSTLLCVMAFLLVFKHKKMCWVVQFTVEECEDRTAINIYKELVRQQGKLNVWLLLDGL